MSAVLERRNADGVLLRYPDPTVVWPYQTKKKTQPSDRRRTATIKAEREVRILFILAEHLEISDIGRSRIFDALKSIETALNMARAEIGLRRK